MATNDIRAVGFDLGETLYRYVGMPVSWADHYGAALRAVAQSCEFNLTPAMEQTGEAILHSFNTRMYPREREVSARHIFSRLCLGWGIEPHDEFIEAAIERFFGYFRQHVEAYEDSRSVLLRLRELELKTGAATDVPYGMPREFVEKDLFETKLTDCFDAVVTSVDARFRKPHPAPFFALAEALQVSPQHMIFVGNEPKDVRGANGAGMRAVLLCRDSVPGSYGQFATLSSLDGLLQLVR